MPILSAYSLFFYKKKKKKIRCDVSKVDRGCGLRQGTGGARTGDDAAALRGRQLIPELEGVNNPHFTTSRDSFSQVDDSLVLRYLLVLTYSQCKAHLFPPLVPLRLLAGTKRWPDDVKESPGAAAPTAKASQGGRQPTSGGFVRMYPKAPRT